MASSEPQHILELPFVLRHPAVSNSLGTVARLLCTSREIAAAVLTHAAGRPQHLKLKYPGWGCAVRDAQRKAT
jgi:hypothetical protein